LAQLDNVAIMIIVVDKTMSTNTTARALTASTV